VRTRAAAIVRSRTLEGHRWADDLRSWSHVVKRRAAALAAAALARSPCWRAWCLTGACRLDAPHRRVRVARNEALTVGSATAIVRRFTPSTRNINHSAAGWIRGPPSCADAESTYPTLVKEAAASAPRVLRIGAANRRRSIQQSLLSVGVSRERRRARTEPRL
jgi:hypothetical protein